MNQSQSQSQTKGHVASEPQEETDRVAAADAAQSERGEVPSTAETYERAKPDQEDVGGQMTANKFTPAPEADEEDEAVVNQSEARELTADDAANQREAPDLSNVDPNQQQPARPAAHQQGRQQNLSNTASQVEPDPESDRPATSAEHDPAKPISPEPDHSMQQEQPLGWDEAPKGRGQFPAGNTRHPRQGGKGGTPDVGEDESEG